MKSCSIKILLMLLLFSVVHNACSADTKTNAYVKAWITSCHKTIKQEEDKKILKDHLANMLDAPTGEESSKFRSFDLLAGVTF